MILFETSTAQAYPGIIDFLSGEPRTESRAGDTREVIGASVRSDSPRERYVVRDGKWNLAFQLQEHFAYWRGLNPGHVERYNSAMEDWMVDGELPGSAYGDRLRNKPHDQINRAVSQLSDNPESRRAVMQVHQVAEEDYQGGDVSCTESLQVFIRDGKLHMIAVIRSQDMYWGYTYDAANNQFIQELMAGILGVEVGDYIHQMNSCHYYIEKENDALQSRFTSEARSFADMSLSECELEATMGRLQTSLYHARNGRTSEYTKLPHPFDDWARIMTSYEQYRHHDATDTAIEIADSIETEWARDWTLRQIME